MPLDRISYSAVREYLNNPWRFYKTYILKEYSFTDSPAILVGRAFHKTLELYYSSPAYRTERGREYALETGCQIIHAAASQVDWGVTGSVEKSIKEAHQTVLHYFNEDPRYEERGALTPEAVLHGRLRGIPVEVKAVADLMIKTDNDIIIVDFKKVSKLTDTLSPIYMLQAAFNFWAHKADRGTYPTRMIFHEVKTAQNRDASSQIREHVVDFTSNEWRVYEKLTKKLVQTVVKEANKKTKVWLPNINDMYEGEASWNEWVASC